MSFSIRLTDEERGMVEAYAKLQGLSVGETFKKAVFNEIEDHYDLVIAESAYQEYLDEGKKSRPIEELWKELDI